MLWWNDQHFYKIILEHLKKKIRQEKNARVIYNHIFTFERSLLFVIYVAGEIHAAGGVLEILEKVVHHEGSRARVTVSGRRRNQPVSFQLSYTSFWFPGIKVIILLHFILARSSLFMRTLIFNCRSFKNVMLRFIYNLFVVSITTFNRLRFIFSICILQYRFTWNDLFPQHIFVYWETF